ncbi:MAG: hypothetical protein AAGF77_10525 [Bacteroidota bacterium]
MNYLRALWVAIFITSCGGGDDGPPPAPGQATLVFPLQNSECTTGEEIGETQTAVPFEWQASERTDRYTVRVVNLENDQVQTAQTGNTTVVINIEKGAPFSWTVVSSNTSSDETTTSEAWLFYNAGPQTNYAPFPAQIIAPASGSTITLGDGTVVLRWSGADVENDITNFEVYFSEENPPETLLETTNSNTGEATASITSGTLYFWKVITVDAQGNQSDSGVFDFRVL